MYFHIQKKKKKKREYAPNVGLEPTTLRLRFSTAERKERIIMVESITFFYIIIQRLWKNRDRFFYALDRFLFERLSMENSRKMNISKANTRSLPQASFVFSYSWMSNSKNKKNKWKLTFDWVTAVNQLCLSRAISIQPILIVDCVFALTCIYFPARYRW